MQNPRGEGPWPHAPHPYLRRLRLNGPGCRPATAGRELPSPKSHPTLPFWACSVCSCCPSLLACPGHAGHQLPKRILAPSQTSFAGDAIHAAKARPRGISQPRKRASRPLLRSARRGVAQARRKRRTHPAEAPWRPVTNHLVAAKIPPRRPTPGARSLRHGVFLRRSSQDALPCLRRKSLWPRHLRYEGWPGAGPLRSRNFAASRSSAPPPFGFSLDL